MQVKLYKIYKFLALFNAKLQFIIFSIKNGKFACNKIVISDDSFDVKAICL